MAGTIIYMLEVAHVFQRRFDSKSLETALGGSHIYLISRRPAVRIDPASVRVHLHGIAFEVTTRRAVPGAVERHGFTLVVDDQISTEDFRTYLNGTYFSFRANDLLVHGDSWALTSLASVAREDLARHEIMYIGQAFGRDGATDVAERTRRHETLQRIYEHHAGEDWDIFVTPVMVDQTLRTTLDHIDDHDYGLDPDALRNDGVLAEEGSGKPLAPAIDVIEHSLIEFFRPPYNQKLMTWNPDRPTQAMKLLRGLGFRLVVVQLSGWQGLARFHSEAQPKPQRSHVIAHELVVSRGADGRVNPEEHSPNWQLDAILGIHSSLAQAAEQSGVGLNIFGDGAPRVRRPPDALLPDVSKMNYRTALAQNQSLPEFVPYSGPSLDPRTGLVVTGVGADDTRHHWRLFEPGDGLCNGIIVGPPGIGKTSQLRILAVDIVHSGFLEFYYADPRGRHRGMLCTIAKGVARTPDESVEQLRIGVTLMRSRRRKYLMRLGRREPFAASAAEPGVYLFIEDAHLVFTQSREAALLAERIATEGNRLGVAMIATLPDLNIARFGDRPLLRDALRRVNQAAMGGLDAYEMFDEGER